MVQMGQNVLEKTLVDFSCTVKMNLQSDFMFKLKISKVL